MDSGLVEYLIRAKRATYAGKGAETVSSREKSHDELLSWIAEAAVFAGRK